METRHIRIDYESGLSLKKQLLSSEMNLLHILKKIKSYKVLRKKELSIKNIFKNQIKDLSISLMILNNTLPKDKISEPEKLKPIINKEEARNIQDELKEIKMKLEKLE